MNDPAWRRNERRVIDRIDKNDREREAGGANPRGGTYHARVSRVALQGLQMANASGQRDQAGRGRSVPEVWR